MSRKNIFVEGTVFRTPAEEGGKVEVSIEVE